MIKAICIVVGLVVLSWAQAESVNGIVDSTGAIVDTAISENEKKADSQVCQDVIENVNKSKIDADTIAMGGRYLRYHGEDLKTEMQVKKVLSGNEEASRLYKKGYIRSVFGYVCAGASGVVFVKLLFPVQYEDNPYTDSNNVNDKETVTIGAIMGVVSLGAGVALVFNGESIKRRAIEVFNKSKIDTPVSLIPDEVSVSVNKIALTWQF